MVVAVAWRAMEPGSIPGGCTKLTQVGWPPLRSHKPGASQVQILDLQPIYVLHMPIYANWKCDFSQKEMSPGSTPGMVPSFKGWVQQKELLQPKFCSPARRGQMSRVRVPERHNILFYFNENSLVWPCCSGSNLDCDSGSTGSTPVGHPKEFLCSSGGEAQRNSLQNCKTVSSNLTCYSKFIELSSMDYHKERDVRSTEPGRTGHPVPARNWFYI